MIKKLLPLLLLSYFLLFIPWGHYFNDPDSFWQLFFGKWMLENRVLPPHALFAFTNTTVPVVPHEFAFQLLAGLFYKLGGFDLSFLLIPFGIYALSFSLAFLFKKSAEELGLRLDFFPSLFLSLIISHALEAYLHLRPQLFSYSIFTLSLAFILEIKTSGLKTKHFLLFFFFSLFLANFHGGLWALLPGLWLIFCLSSALQKRLNSKYILVFVLIGIGGLLNPSGLASLSYFKHIQTIGLGQFVQEWKPANFSNYRYFIPVLIFLWASSFSLRRDYFRLFFGFFTLILGLLCLKTMVFLLLFLPLFLAEPVARSRFSNISYNRKILFPLILVFFLLNSSLFVFKKEKINPSSFPVEELAYLKEKGANSIYTDYGSGGYAITQSFKVFSYGVFDAFAYKKNKEELSIFEDTLLAHMQLEHLAELSKKYPFEYIVLSHEALGLPLDKNPLGLSYYNYRVGFLKKNFGEALFEGKYGLVFKCKN